MARRVTATALNGRTIDILNVIRQNASYEYQNTVPTISDATDVPKVGEVIYGNPTLSNEFINALVNRIALVVVSSTTFDNPYADLKKGYLEFGETVEDIFVKIAKVQEFSVEKAPAREFKRTIPQVLSSFYSMNWRVMYPVTIQREDLRRAFLSVDGVENLINQILEQVYTAANYDEFLLFKYLLIKAIAHGQCYPVSFDADNPKDGAKQFRGIANDLGFMKTKYNEAGVLTATPKDRLHVFMDSFYNAEFDVEVLSAAFNMEKADFMGRLRLIDDFTTFDNERWSEIRANSDCVEEVTSTELALMANVKAVIADENWFQIYDNEAQMVDTRVGSGLYWNYFYHVWKTVAHSPYANIVVFVDDSATLTMPSSVTVRVTGRAQGDDSTILTLSVDEATALYPQTARFIQSATATSAGIAVKESGEVIYPTGQTSFTAELMIGSTKYTATLASSKTVGSTISFAKA